MLASLLNALLSGTVLFLFSTKFNYWPSAAGEVFFLTLVFSTPPNFIIWIVLLVNWHKDLLFRSLLKAGLTLSFLSSLVTFILPLGLAPGYQLLVSLCIVVAAISSIMLHHSIIVLTTKRKTLPQCIS